MDKRINSWKASFIVAVAAALFLACGGASAIRGGEQYEYATLNSTGISVDVPEKRLLKGVGDGESARWADLIRKLGGTGQEKGNHEVTVLNLLGAEGWQVTSLSQSQDLILIRVKR